MDSAMLVELPPTAFAFAYGSAVFRQASYADDQVRCAGARPERSYAVQFKNAMLDLIIAVDDPLEWHRENIVRNRSHYSFLASLGPAVVANVQENFGARIYYNPYVRLGNRVRRRDVAESHAAQDAKYGVISTAHLLQDLTHWDTLYVSGRMHKPVRASSSSCARAALTCVAETGRGAASQRRNCTGFDR